MKFRSLSLVPERLVEAREARGLSATELGDLTGVSRQSISAYEKGRQSPGPDTLRRLAEQLNLPTDFFLRPPREKVPPTAFFRSFSAATNRARLRAQRRLSWLEDVINYLATYLDLLDVRLPNFDLGSDPSSVSLESVEQIATKCRRAWGLGDGPISHVVRLLENNGAIITRQDMDTRHLDAFSRWSVSGKRPIVVLGADKDSAVRSRLDAVHELGHLIMHRSLTRLGPYKKLVEEQAFRFGAAFLLPAETFTMDFSVPSLQTFWALKEKWLVSIGAMIKRCEDLGVLNDRRAQQLWINYARKGYRKREPFDDTLPVEEPTFLAKCIQLLVKEGVQSREDIVKNLGLSPKDIEELTGLSDGFFTSANEPVTFYAKIKKRQPPQIGDQRGTVIDFPRRTRDPE